MPNERWRGPDETVFLVLLSPKLFWCFSMRLRLCARRRRLFLRNRSRRRHAFAVAPPARPGFEPGLRGATRLSASFTYRVVRLILVGSTPLDRSPVRDAARRRDVADPPLARDAGVLTNDNPQDGADDRTSRSIHRPASVPLLRLGSLVVPRGRRRRIRNKSIRRRPLWSRSAAASRVFARLLVSRRRRSCTSLPPHRDGSERAVHPSARRPSPVFWSPGT